MKTLEQYKERMGYLANRRVGAANGENRDYPDLLLMEIMSLFKDVDREHGHQQAVELANHLNVRLDILSREELPSFTPLEMCRELGISKETAEKMGIEFKGLLKWDDLALLLNIEPEQVRFATGPHPRSYLQQLTEDYMRFAESSEWTITRISDRECSRCAAIDDRRYRENQWRPEINISVDYAMPSISVDLTPEQREHLHQVIEEHVSIEASRLTNHSIRMTKVEAEFIEESEDESETP